MSAHCLRIVCLVFAGLLPACSVMAPQPSPPVQSAPAPAPPPAPRPLPNVNLSGYPPSFKDGFRDGCNSFRGNYRRDASRFGKDSNYTIGWQDGFSICRRQGN